MRTTRYPNLVVTTSRIRPFFWRVELAWNAVRGDPFPAHGYAISCSSKAIAASVTRAILLVLDQAADAAAAARGVALLLDCLPPQPRRRGPPPRRAP